MIISKYRPEEMLHRFQTLKEYISSCHVPGLNDQHLDRHLDTYLPDNDTWWLVCSGIGPWNILWDRLLDRVLSDMDLLIGGYQGPPAMTVSIPGMTNQLSDQLRFLDWVPSSSDLHLASTLGLHQVIQARSKSMAGASIIWKALVWAFPLIGN